MQTDATEAQFTNPLKEYILYADAVKVSISFLTASYLQEEWNYKVLGDFLSFCLLPSIQYC